VAAVSAARDPNRPDGLEHLFGAVDFDADNISWLTHGVDMNPHGLHLADDPTDWFGPVQSDDRGSR